MADSTLALDVLKADGKKAGSIELPAALFDVKTNIPLIHQVVVAQLAAARQGTHKTKTRAEVRGGGRKPWRQKGTGRARQGSIRAPHWTGGGVVHGPTPRDYSQRTPKKMIAAALLGVISDRARGERIHVVEGFVVDGAYIPGATGNAGHLGQVRREGGLTLEEIASGPASAAWAQQQGWSGATGEDLARDAAAGDAVARAAIERSARAVGEALADAATLVDLDVVAIGGGFSRVSDDYIDLVQGALTASAVHGYSQRTRVVRSGLGDEGPLIGAAALVLR